MLDVSDPTLSDILFVKTIDTGPQVKSFTILYCLYIFYADPTSIFKSSVVVYFPKISESLYPVIYSKQFVSF